MNSVVQDWVSKLSFKQQTVLLAGFRGCDGRVKEDPSKFFTRLLRSTILKNADPSTTFMATPVGEFDVRMDAFFGDIDSYPMHFLVHLLHAAEIVAYTHPDVKMQNVWLKFYLNGVHSLHFNAETKDQMLKRLEDPFPEVSTEEYADLMVR